MSHGVKVTPKFQNGQSCIMSCLSSRWQELKDGYLDDVFDVLDAHRHPCIMLGHFALLWMGAGVFHDHCLDLLIRNSQIAAISADIQSTGNWAEVPFVRTCGQDYLQPPPRIFERTDGTFSIKIWSEDAVCLLVDPTADGRVHDQPFLIETPCCETLNPVLLESDMHPGPKISHRPSLLTTPNIRFLPHIRCQSASRQPQSRVYIPTISRYFDALIAQDQWLQEHERRALSIPGPATSVSYLMRYLFLEMPDQRKKILPLLDSESKIRMEKVLDRYKRTYKQKLKLRLMWEGGDYEKEV